MKVDYIIVGCGLAGISFCEQLKAHNKSFLVFDNNSQHSSAVSGGLYNPVVLKRFSPVWKSKEQLQMALPMYQRIAKDLNIKLDYKIPIYRKFASVEEQNNWFAASDKPGLSEFIAPKIIDNQNKSIKAPYGFGEVLQTGRIATKILIDSYKEHLEEDALLTSQTFEYEKIEHQDYGINYNGISARHIVFAEGYGIKYNPFFNHLPLNGTKGELLTIHAPQLKLATIIKSSVFITPLGNDQYRIGATYHWEDKSNNITQKGRQELINKLKSIITCGFELIDHVAGIRPTVSDRRPLVGRHKRYNNVYVLNGLGSRGVLIGPYVAEQLYELIENYRPLEAAIDINRFSR